MKLIYKPLSIVAGLLAGMLSRRVFAAIWSRIDDEEPPRPEAYSASWKRVVAAQALQGAVGSATRAGVRRAGMKSFHHLTGVWPGDKRE